MITNICFEILNYRAVQNCFLSLRAVAICATYLNNSKQRNYRAVTICCNPLRCDKYISDQKIYKVGELASSYKIYKRGNILLEHCCNPILDSPRFS
jgi:hypothetical protein